MSCYVVVKIDDIYTVEHGDYPKGYETEAEAKEAADFLNGQTFMKLDMRGGRSIPDPRAEERKKANERIVKGLKR